MTLSIIMKSLYLGQKADHKKAEGIMAKMKDGTITREEADAQLAELDIELPQRVKHGDMFENLDEETK